MRTPLVPQVLPPMRALRSEPSVQPQIRDGMRAEAAEVLVVTTAHSWDHP